MPVIGLVQVGSQSIADRYLYMPAIGLFIAVAWEYRRTDGPPWPKETALGAASSGCTGGLPGVDVVSGPIWKDGETCSAMRRCDEE